MTGQFEDDVAAAAPGAVVRLAAGALAVAGLVTALVGFQTHITVSFQGSVEVLDLVPPAMMAVGVAAILVALGLGRARLWAASVGAALATLMGAGNLLWVIFSFTHGVFSLIALMSIAFAILATILIPVSFGPVRRATAARRRLQGEGIDLGI